MKLRKDAAGRAKLRLSSEGEAVRPAAHPPAEPSGKCFICNVGAEIWKRPGKGLRNKKYFALVSVSQDDPLVWRHPHAREKRI